MSKAVEAVSDFEVARPRRGTMQSNTKRNKNKATAVEAFAKKMDATLPKSNVDSANGGVKRRRK